MDPNLGHRQTHPIMTRSKVKQMMAQPRAFLLKFPPEINHMIVCLLGPEDLTNLHILFPELRDFVDAYKFRNMCLPRWRSLLSAEDFNHFTEPRLKNVQYVNL